MGPGDAARLLLLAAVWGGSFAFMRVAVPALGPLWLAFSRVALVFVALFALSLARRSIPPLSAHWRGYLMIGAVNSALPFALFCFAEQYVSASAAAILNATSPFFGALVAALWLANVGSGFAHAHLANANPPVNPAFKQGIRIGSLKDGKVTAFIPETVELRALEGVAADDQGNVYGGYTNTLNFRRWVKQ